jgi:hypothetical protein
MERDEFPERYVYFAPEVDTWLRATLRRAVKDRSNNLSPYEQAEQLLYDFAIGRPMAYSVHYRKLDPIVQHIWELKTEDVRLIGWFPQKRHFVVVCGRLKREIPRAKLYGPCVECSIWFRSNLDLEEPKAITGVSHRDIL